METTLTPGGRGQFDLVANGTVLYSKADTDRFPDPGEAVRLLKGLAS